MLRVPISARGIGRLHEALLEKILSLYQLYRTSPGIVFLDEMIFYLAVQAKEPRFPSFMKYVFKRLREFEESSDGETDNIYTCIGYLAVKLDLISLIKF